jgi:hypothetical protein
MEIWPRYTRRRLAWSDDEIQKRGVFFSSIERTGDRQMTRMISDEWVNDLDGEWINQMSTREPHRYLKNRRGKDDFDDFTKRMRSDFPRWLCGLPQSFEWINEENYFASSILEGTREKWNLTAHRSSPWMSQVSRENMHFHSLTWVRLCYFSFQNEIPDDHYELFKCVWWRFSTHEITRCLKKLRTSRYFPSAS